MSAFAERVQQIRETGKGARLVARSFYRELRQAGFADHDIMAIADELLGCLAATLRLARMRHPVAGMESRGPA